MRWPEDMDRTLPRGPREGDTVQTWFSGDVSGRSRVLFICDYVGAYPETFGWTALLTASNTRAGDLGMTIPLPAGWYGLARTSVFHREDCDLCRT